MKRHLSSLVTKVLLLAATAATLPLSAQQVAPVVQQPSAAGFYREFLAPAFSSQEIFQIREVSIEREDLHFALTDGVIAFMKAVDGHVTGAVFEGAGEVLLRPPDRAERTSLDLFTGSAVLEQRFTSAYIRFFDDKLYAELKAGTRPLSEPHDITTVWEPVVKVLARADALQLLAAVTNSDEASSSFLHLRLGGSALGVFDVFLNTNSPEQITVAQANTANTQVYYNVWNSFPMRSARQQTGRPNGRATFDAADYRIRVKLRPPTDLGAEGEFTLTPRTSGLRTVVLELSRFLRLAEVRLDGRPIEFIQNEAISGSDLARRGDDLIAVVSPKVLDKGVPVKVQFKYAGPLMSDSGGDVIYVGDRGTWYPNAGPAFSKFDLSFEYPSEWSVLATGNQISNSVENGMRTTQFTTPRPIARAGFNLGKFETASAAAGDVEIHAYAAKHVEQSLAQTEARAGRHPEPARQVQRIAAQAAVTVQFLSAELDPFPYANLDVTQLPALLSQSWPGLIYLSSMAYLSPDERRAVGIRDPYTELLLNNLMLSHETAHQWWGDAVDSASYRDEWIVEALANYSALLMLERGNPEIMKIALDHYREELMKQGPNGALADAGPVTLGARLTSSRFPNAFEPVLYGRGTWLIHMLRTMLRMAGGGQSDAQFFAALKGLLAKSPDHKISTLDLQRAFEQQLPRQLTYEGKRSLDWFFDSWVNGTAVPSFSLEDVKVADTGTRAKVTGTIRQDKAPRDMVTAVPLYSVDKVGHSHFLAFVFVDDPKTSFTLTAPAGTKELLLDPDDTVLRR